MGRIANPVKWKLLFIGAAIFNYVIGFPILLARNWSYTFSFASSVGKDPMAMRLWADFGFAVVLIGFGYQIVSRDVSQNRGVVLLGIIAKLFDVLNLSLLYSWGYAKPIVLLPAAIDGAFVVAFLVFWFVTKRSSAAS